MKEDHTPSPEYQMKPAEALPNESTSAVEIATDKNGDNVDGDDETTIFETSGRVYARLDRMQLNGTIEQEWARWDVSILKIKQDQKTLKTRLVAISTINNNVLVVS